MLIVNNEETADDYSDACTIESPYGGRLVYLVANASAVVQMRRIPDDPHALVHDYGPEQVLTPQSSFVDKISAARFRSAVAGSPARIVASLSEPGDVLPASGTPFTGILAPSGGVGVTGVINKATALVDVVSTNAETDIYNFVIPAGTLTSDGQLRLYIAGDILNNAAGSLTLRMYLGGVLLWSDIEAVGINANRHPWEWRITISALGATNSQILKSRLNLELVNVVAPTVGAGLLNLISAGEAGATAGAVAASTSDMTAAQTLRVTAQWSAASANLSWRKQYAILEAIS